jgi:hypothetical protein
MRFCNVYVYFLVFFFFFFFFFFFLYSMPPVGGIIHALPTARETETDLCVLIAIIVSC